MDVYFDRLQIFLIAILLLCVSILGYLAFFDAASNFLPKAGQDDEEEDSEVLEPTHIQRGDFEALSEEEKTVLANADFELAKKLAQDAAFVEISGCMAMPVVSHVSGDSVKIRNSDGIFHTVSFDPSHVYTVEPGETQTIDLSFPPDESVLSFGCDWTTEPVGVIFTEE